MNNHHCGFLLTLLCAGFFGLAGLNNSRADAIVTFEAESGTLGANWSVVGGTPTYITIVGTGGGDSPGGEARVASFSVNFPSAGTYNLYGRVRTGPDPFNDDSFFYANGFGAKSATDGAAWILCNNTVNGGFTNPGDVVSGAGTAGGNVWKWINLSQYTGEAGESPVTFTVPEDNLTQTFQIGAREDGFDMDKFAFGTAGTLLTVSNLDSGTLPTPPPPLTNAFPGPDGIALHRFSPLANGVNTDGANPAAGLTSINGVLIGTTLNGGANGAGTAFYLSADGLDFVTFRTFASAPDANSPEGELPAAGNGFFGTSLAGGTGGVGTVFAGQTNGTISVLRHFTSPSADNATNNGGASPVASLALSGGRIFGATTAGGSAGNGTIFSITTNAASFSVLHNFSLLDSQTGTNADGATPRGGLIVSGDKLYGTASGGGAGGNGVVFSISTNGSGFTTLHSFSPMDTHTTTNDDGAIPMAGLVLAGNTLYGTTFAGGHGGRGTIFSLETNGGGFTVLHHFSATDSFTGTNTGGASPAAALIQSGSVLYGTASGGGAGAAGTVFSMNPGTAQFTTLHSFAALSNGTNAHGAFPVAPLMRQGNTLYGTTFSGGPGGAGTVFGIPLPSSPAVITSILRNEDSSVTLHFLGASNSTNVIQSTTNLAPPVTWLDVSTNVADDNGVWQFNDDNNAAARYYRSVAQ